MFGRNTTSEPEALFMCFRDASSKLVLLSVSVPEEALNDTRIDWLGTIRRAAFDSGKLDQDSRIEAALVRQNLAVGTVTSDKFWTPIDTPLQQKRKAYNKAPGWYKELHERP